jgi:hypothetical protein
MNTMPKLFRTYRNLSLRLGVLAVAFTLLGCQSQPAPQLSAPPAANVPVISVDPNTSGNIAGVVSF